MSGNRPRPGYNQAPKYETVTPAHYYRWPKGFTEPDPDRLVRVAPVLARSVRPDHRVAGASAYFEAAAALGHRSVWETTEDYVVKGESLLKGAITDLSTRLTNELEVKSDNAPRTFGEILYAERHLAFTELYLDLAYGELTSESLALTYDQLRHQLQDYTRMRDVGEDGLPRLDPEMEKVLIGAETELIILMACIQGNEPAHGATPSSLTLPSTIRGGNGTNNPGDTHDLVHLILDDACRILDAHYLEIKTSTVNDETRHRYEGSRLGVRPVNAHTEFDLAYSAQRTEFIDQLIVTPFGNPQLGENIRRTLLGERRARYQGAA